MVKACLSCGIISGIRAVDICINIKNPLPKAHAHFFSRYFENMLMGQQAIK